MKSTMKPMEPGLYPFWFWNGRLDENEIIWQIDQMAEKGVRGFFIHSRQGLKQPYLSESFFQMVKVALKQARKHGMAVHLYDEYPYPSGIAGGEVTLGNPRFHATSLVQRAYDSSGGNVRLELPRGKVLCCMAYPVAGESVQWRKGIDLRKSIGMVLVDDSYEETGLTTYNRKRYFASTPTPVLETELASGEYRIFASVQKLVDTHKYWDNFVDVLNPEAVQEFIRLTHERYYERFGKDFGTLIHSIFVDETESGWSELLPPVFQKECGYDLIPLLPALQDRTHPQHLKVMYDLKQVRYKMFCKAWEEQIAGWCRKHNIRYSGEKPSDRFAQLKYMDIPGCDPGHTKAGAEKSDLLRPALRQNARGCASAAYFYGKEGALTECYHSMGWSGTLLDARLVGEALLQMGIKYLVPHGFFYTTHGLVKHDAPPTFFFQMPYWPLFGDLSRRFARVSQELGDMHIDTQMLIIEPSAGLPTREDSAAYESLLHRLMAENIDFMMADVDILKEGRVGNGVVRIKDIEARLIVVPPVRVLAEPLKKWLAAFAQKGGKVIYCRMPLNEDEAISRILKVVGPSLRITASHGDARRIHAATWAGGGRKLWFIRNTAATEMEVEFNSGCPLKEVVLDDGLPAMLSRIDGRHFRRLRPFESLVLEETKEHKDIAAPEAMRMKVGGSAKVHPLSKNLVRMYDWQMTLMGADGKPQQTAAVPAMTLAKQLDKGRFAFVPDMRHFFGRVPEMKLPKFNLLYRYTFENQYNGTVELVMEPDSLVGEWEVRVNGERFGAAAFKETDAHVRGSLGADITAAMMKGRNEIAVSLRTDRLDGGLVNALYLAGEFGVKLDPVRLVERSSRGSFDAWEDNGLPYYAGAVEYEMAAELAQVPESGKVLVEFECAPQFQDACEISMNGGRWHRLPWVPRVALVDRSDLRTGENRLRVRVYTTLIRSFEGQWFNTAAHCYREI
ncbi:MAG TPA: glycosyl hydrolase [Sedimentisphaerales bacterium]|nr:glycosyl hydrolase [Sedimentisphaerales bacterium]